MPCAGLLAPGKVEYVTKGIWQLCQIQNHAAALQASLGVSKSLRDPENVTMMVPADALLQDLSAGLALLRTKEPPEEHCRKSFAPFDRLAITGSQPWKKQPGVERRLASHSIVSTFEASKSTEIVQLSPFFRHMRIRPNLERKQLKLRGCLELKMSSFQMEQTRCIMCRPSWLIPRGKPNWFE